MTHKFLSRSSIDNSIMASGVLWAVQTIQGLIKTTLKRCGITSSEFETFTIDRTDWLSSCKSAVEELEVQRIQELESKRDLRKSGPPSTSNFDCQICHRMCRSRIGLNAGHCRRHL